MRSPPEKIPIFIITDHQIMSSHFISDPAKDFITKGFIRVDNAFTPDLASEARAILWREMNCQPDDPSTWTRPVVRLGMFSQKPFIDAANTPLLHRMYDELIGRGNWIPPNSMGAFVVRFLSDTEADDTGWHVDASFPGHDPSNYLDWRINCRSKGRALLMLFLFSDISEKDAPTRIRLGSHLDVAASLKSAGEEGLSFMELAGHLHQLPDRPEVLATGKAGTVYLCHPLLVHAAQAHRGNEPRFLAQPPLLFRNEPILERPDGNYTPLEQSLRGF